MRSGVGLAESLQRLVGRRAQPSFSPSMPTDLQAAQRLLEGFLEGAADGHHLADRLHLRGQAANRPPELLEGERGILVTT